MTLAVIDWLSISINLLLVIFVIVCLLMSLLILMQRPKQEGLGAAFGGGVTDQVFGARTTNVLQRGTVYLASLFFLIALALAVLIGHQNKKTSMLESKAPAAEVEEQPVAEPREDLQPKSLIEELPAETPVDATEGAPVDPAPAEPGESAPADPSDAPPAGDAAAPADEAPAAPDETSDQP